MWADTVGDASYTFDELLPYFKKSIRFQPPNTDLRDPNSTVPFNTSAFSSDGNPLPISYPNSPNAFSSWAKLALAELGLEERTDFLSGSLLGYQYTTQTIDRDSQTRSSSETSFLRNALLATDNLVVYKSTLARKILFDPDKRATGVSVNTAGAQYTLTARKEVILSAGVVSCPSHWMRIELTHKGQFRSPQMLMVSGIGPASQLNPLGIPILADRPGVGQNMWV